MSKPAFDPGKPFETEKPAFDPDKPFEQEKGKDASFSPEAAAEGFGNAMTLGYLPHISAAATKGVQKVSDFLDDLQGIDSYRGGRDSYVELRDKLLSNQEKLAKENPWSYGAGSAAGIAGSALLMPGSALAKGASLGQKVGAGAKLGALYGALANPGDTLGELSPLQLADRGSNALVGGAVGAAIPAAIGGLEKAAGGLKNLAERRAFDALGGGKAAVAEATEKGQLNNIGRQLLDEGVVKFGSGKQAIADRLEQSVADKSNALKGALESVRSGAGLSPEQMAQVDASRFNPKVAGDALKTKIRDQFSALPEDVVQSRLSQVDKFLSKNAPLNIDQAQAMKQQISKFIKDPTYWKDSANPGQETLAGIRRMIKEGIEKNADAYAGALGEAGGKVKSINQSLGNTLQAQGVVEDRLARDMANRTFSLTDYLAGAGGSVAGGPMGAVTGAASALANKIARERGSSAIAAGADSTSKLIQNLLQSPRFQSLANSSPQAFSNMATALSRKISPATTDAAPDEVKDRFLSGN